MKKSYEIPTTDILSLDMVGSVLNSASLTGASSSPAYDSNMYVDDEEGVW